MKIPKRLRTTVVAQADCAVCNGSGLVIESHTSNHANIVTVVAGFCACVEFEVCNCIKRTKKS